MFPEDTLHALTRETLAGEIIAREWPRPAPLDADSYIARSVLQKAIRRGMTDLALKAASALIVTDRRTLWRRLLVTALEDLGVGEIDLLARIVAAMGDHGWRSQIGGEWVVLAELVAQACEGTRCQAANDLWNVARNAPELDAFKVGLCEADLRDLARIVADPDRPVEERGVAVLLALGEDVGSAAPTHLTPDPGMLFSAFASAGHYSHAVAVHQDAFRRTGLALAPLSLCLWPLSGREEPACTDDDLPPAAWRGEVPTFALDQYTRAGAAAIRQFTRSNQPWIDFAGQWGIERTDHAKAAGELLFRGEGARVTRRRLWSAGHRLNCRSLTVGCFMPEAAVLEGLALIRREQPALDLLRA